MLHAVVQRCRQLPCRWVHGAVLRGAVGLELGPFLAGRLDDRRGAVGACGALGVPREDAVQRPGAHVERAGRRGLVALGGLDRFRGVAGADQAMRTRCDSVMFASSHRSPPFAVRVVA